MKYYWMRETELDGIPLVVSRTGWSGELGYELYLRDRHHGDRLWEMIMEAGKPFGIAPTAPNTIRSVEGGLLSYDSDITRADCPFTLGVDWLFDLDQDDDFIGKDALLKIRAEGHKRRLVGVVVAGDPFPHGNSHFWPVLEAGRKIGHITRCVTSPRLGKNIGFANVPTTHSAIGTTLELDTEFGVLPATVCEWPWVPAEKIMPDPKGLAAA
jgi:aminomethyltransferase